MAGTAAASWSAAEDDAAAAASTASSSSLRRVNLDSGDSGPPMFPSDAASLTSGANGLAVAVDCDAAATATLFPPTAFPPCFFFRTNPVRSLTPAVASHGLAGRRIPEDASPLPLSSEEPDVVSQ